MCKVMLVSQSGYYKWLKEGRPNENKKSAWDHEIKEKIKEFYYVSGATYGSPRIHDDLIEAGYSISPKTVARKMKEIGLKATPEFKYKATTDSGHSFSIYPNLVKRNFNAAAPGLIWVADITYVWTLEGWVYLASVMDLYSRKIVGWNIGTRMTKELPKTALERAIQYRKPTSDLIHHSDRGSQYCSNEYVNLLEKYGVQISMSRKGDPYDNACIESFHATIKKELIYRTRFMSRQEAISAITTYIVSFYNERRKHSTLGYSTPNKVERAYRLLSMSKIS
jgi:putative transposase